MFSVRCPDPNATSTSLQDSKKMEVNVWVQLSSILLIAHSFHRDGERDATKQLSCFHMKVATRENVVRIEGLSHALTCSQASHEEARPQKRAHEHLRVCYAYLNMCTLVLAPSLNFGHRPVPP